MSEQIKGEKDRKQDQSNEDEEYVEVVPAEEREGEEYLLEEETPIDKVAVDERAEEIAEQQAAFTEEEEIEEILAERQKLSRGGREEFEEDLEEHHTSSPDLAGGDVDADWEGANTGSGAEAVGGSEPTPDQDVVDELGEAVGITYEDDEPLNIEKKIREKRESRLEPPDKESLFTQDKPSHQDQEEEAP